MHTSTWNLSGDETRLILLLVPARTRVLILRRVCKNWRQTVGAIGIDALVVRFRSDRADVKRTWRDQILSMDFPQGFFEHVARPIPLAFLQPRALEVCAAAGASELASVLQGAACAKLRELQVRGFVPHSRAMRTAVSHRHAYHLLYEEGVLPVYGTVAAFDAVPSSVERLDWTCPECPLPLAFTAIALLRGLRSVCINLSSHLPHAEIALLGLGALAALPRLENIDLQELFPDDEDDEIDPNSSMQEQLVRAAPAIALGVCL